METKKQKLKRLRKEFNHACRVRDGGQCVCCIDDPVVTTGTLPSGDKLWSSASKRKNVFQSEIAVHHITDRHEMPNDGYAEENGICVCEFHHEAAEVFHVSKGEEWIIHPDDLYKLIGSSKEKALKACENLK
jgi:hypothetical protein